MIYPNSIQARDIESYIHCQTNLDLHRQIGPLVVARGSGLSIYDDDGKEYIDAVSGLWCASLGFSNDRVAKVAQDQLKTLGYYHTTVHMANRPAVELAERILACAPVPMSKVLFQCSGSEANDYAIKIAWYYQHAVGKPERRKIIGRKFGYHGSTIASLSASGLPLMHSDFGLPIQGFVHAEPAHYYRYHEDGETEEAFASRLAESFEDLILREGPETVAAFIAEPMMGAGGMILPPRTYFEKIQRVLNKYEILLIADEVICGFGRTGEMWGSTTFGLKPDLITCAKALSAGFQPISAVVINDKIYQQMLGESRKLGAFAHSATYGGHPVAAAVAVEVQKIYEEMDVLRRVREAGGYLKARLTEFTNHPMVGEIQCAGLSAALEIVKSKQPRCWFDPEVKIGERLASAAREHGLIIRIIRDRLTLAPAFIATNSDIDRIIDRVGKTINTVASQIT